MDVSLLILLLLKWLLQVGLLFSRLDLLFGVLLQVSLSQVEVLQSVLLG